MTHTYDETKLSAYMDGELEDTTLHEIELLLKTDERAKQYVLDAVKSAARLKAGMNRVLNEAVPERLLKTIKSPREGNVHRKSFARRIVSVAAMVVFLLAGFGAGTMFKRYNSGNGLIMLDGMPSDFEPVVDAALENNLSGSPREWQSSRYQAIVTVTPVKTYRDRKGTYYREYRLEIAKNDHSRKVNGLAYRTAGGRWKTRALYFDNSI